MEIKKILKKVILYSNAITHKNEPKVFCISMQRTGTTSVGKFFRDFGFRWVGWSITAKNEWTVSCYNGDYEKIFSSLDFKSANAYEDAPWFYPGFFKVLYHRFPNAKFVLFMRDADAWYKSMVKHSGGDVLGRADTHCKTYRRELEYFDLLNSGRIDTKTENALGTEKIMKITNQAEHYKDIYHLHSVEVQDFFARFSPDALFVGSLEDPEKWHKLGKFLGVQVPDDYNSHENNSR